jgi:transcriptional regulator with XRE-family HTH domain
VALHDRIKQRRLEAGFTAAELAQRAGISKGYVSEIESGHAQRPSAAVLYKMATVLGTTVADLLEQESTPVAATVPEALKQFAADAGLPEGDVRMLAQIKFRGKQPRNAEDWRYLYESIRRSVVTGDA